jgi:hypothetical protein
MTNQFRNKCLLLFLVVSLISTRCSNNDGESKLALDTTGHKIKNPRLFRKVTTAYLSQDTLTSFLYRCKIINANKRARLPFNKFKYDKVIAYDYDGVDGEHVFRIVENNKLVLKIKQQQQLNQKQVDDLTNWLGAISTYGGTYAFCFEPHFGIVFYYNNKIIANISISMGCNFLDSSVPIPATKATSIEISKDYKYPAKGFSKIGSQRFILLAKDLNFSIH